MKIHSIYMQNFKGIKDNLVILNGQSARIFGDNATGKTTIYDAFLWLLFDKDSSGSSAFGIKTRENGVEIPQIDHIVEGVVEVGAGKVTLRKTYREKWVKKRGKVDREFEGHETLYEINGVPKSKGEYGNFINSIMPEAIFRLVTSPSYFNSLPWKYRRDMLIETCGDVTTDDVLDKMATLGNKDEISNLTVLLNQHSLDDLKRIMNADRKKINEELSGIPGRIDEANKAMPDVTGNLGALSEQAQRISRKIESMREEKLAMESGGAVQKLLQKVSEVDTKIGQARAAHANITPDVFHEREQIKALEKELEVIAPSRIEYLRKKESELIEKSKSLGNEWFAISAKGFTPKGPCPTCGQEWPENLQDVAESEFNVWKSSELERIKKEGTDNGNALAATRTAITEAIDIDENNNQRIVSLNNQIKSISTSIDKKLNIPPFETTPEYEELQRQRIEIEMELQTAKKAGETSSLPIEEKITELQGDLDATNKQISQIEVAETQTKRIEELKQREKVLAAAFEESEQVLYMADLFERTRAEMLDISISGKFDLVRWTLSNEQINGGINPTCICTVNGVPYPDLNTAAKIQAGLDIIKTISREKNVSAPVVIDGAESITQIPPMDGQVIELIVSEQDKELRVELID